MKMGKAEEKVFVDREYTRIRIPHTARRPIIAPMAVWVGYCFFPAGIAASISIGAAFKFTDTILITLGGCVILAIISGIMGSMGQREGMTFALAARFAWGTQGYKVAALIIPIGLIGWNSIHLNVAAGFVEQIAADASGGSGAWAYYVSCIIFALVFGFVAVKGFKYVAIIGYICVPIVVVLLGISAYRGLELVGGWSNLFAAAPSNPGSMTIAAGITSMVGTFACGAGGGSADIQRFNKTQGQAWIVAIVTFVLAYPYLMITGAMAAIGSGTGSMVDTYIHLGLLLIGGIAIVFLTWTTCDSDYYSSSLSFSAVIGSKREHAVVAIVSCACILSLLRPQNFLTGWLTAMAAIMVPLVGIAAADYFIINKGRYPEPSTGLKGTGGIPKIKWAAVIALVAGAATLVLSNKTGFLIPPINCIVVSAVVHVIFAKILPQKSDFNDLIDEKVRTDALNAPPIK
jgi:cytosine permease